MEKQTKYPLMDPKIDFAFKQLFAGKGKESKILLVDLLNSIFNSNNDEITDIIYLNPYTDKEYDDTKQSIMDIKVETQKGEVIDIEMQIQNVDGYRKRSLFYWASMYMDQIHEGESYHELKKCIVINITNFNLITQTGKYHNTFNIKEKTEDIVLLEDLEIHYLELSKLPDEENVEELTPLEQWLYFLRDAADEQKQKFIGEIRKKKGEINMAGDVLERISQDRKAREAYYQRRKWYLDKVSSEKYLLSKGREEGKQEGIAETVLRLLTKKLGEVPEEYVSKLMAQEKPILDSITDSIFDIESIEDLDKYLN
ncbi:MAG TPA: Rpn family recombination-promoting nuclease/putative transposase [Thermoanaerobacterales bacterium]|nr:Rpn family recombination-promoting nuclease/putative transposase [Thermoanaerobacterales bacterium]